MDFPSAFFAGWKRYFFTEERAEESRVEFPDEAMIRGEETLPEEVTVTEILTVP